MRARLFTLLLLLIPVWVQAAELLLNPRPQTNQHTCQSYQIAFGLSYTGEPQYKVDTTRQLRAQEAAFRKVLTQVASEAKGPLNGDTANHQNWQKAVRAFTNGRYSLRIAYYKSIGELYRQIALHTGNDAVHVTGAALAGLTVKQPVFTSVQRIGPNSYGAGHVVAVFGYAKPNNMTPASDALLPIAILNSAIKVGKKQIRSNMCSLAAGDEVYRAEANIQSDYELKQFGNLGYNLLWLERSGQQRQKSASRR